jgi:hypothetical protein
MLMLMLASVLGAAPALAPSIGEQWAQLTFRSRMVVRVQSVPAKPVVVRALREKKGPRCMKTNTILAAAVLNSTGVDLVLRGGDRVRVRFAASCPGLNYYSGFYLSPSDDGQVCADRDIVRDRAGGGCAIEKFRKLVPAK